MQLSTQIMQVACMALLVGGCSSGGSVGIGGVGIGGGSSGVGVGLSFPVGGSTADNDALADCEGDVYRVTPRYPQQAAAQQFSGRVTVSFNVKLNGRAADYNAAGDNAFFEETKRAVLRSCWPEGVRQNLVVSYSNGKEVTWQENSL